MKSLPRYLFLLLALLGAVGLQAQSAKTKPGYNIVAELHFNEQGAVEDVKIVQSEDPTGDHVLEQMALKLAAQVKQPPRVVDGKPVKFKARAPFNFPVEGDEGPTSMPTPRLKGEQVLPAWPDALAAKGEMGGAIVELIIRADGTVKSTRVLRASHPEFGEAAQTALSQWKFSPTDTPGAPAESRWNAAVGFTLGNEPVDLKWRLAPRPSLGSFTRGRPLPEPAKTPAPAAEAPATTSDKK
jgi:TonB family protein